MLYDVTSIKEVLTEFFKAILSDNNISLTLSIFLFLTLIILPKYIKSKEKIYIELLFIKYIVPVFIIIILFFLCDNKTLFVCLSLCSAILLDIFYFYFLEEILEFIEVLNLVIKGNPFEFLFLNENAEQDENTFISNDNPIMNNKQDLLGRDEFIEDLKHTLINYSENFNKEGIVLTLSADWGEGKTSCINLLKNSLQKENFQFIDINPWFNDSKDKVLNAIFGELNHFAKINPPYQSLEKEFYEIIKLSKINFNGIIGNIELALDKFTQNKNIKTKIEEVGTILKRYSKKIIIVIDDIDRLDKTHILYILQVVQMFRQYTNIIFILSCNCEKVEEILCEMSEPCTNINDNNKLQTTNMIKKTVYYRDYLEKISTITIKLPKINHFYIHNYLKETMLNILQKLDDKNKNNFDENKANFEENKNKILDILQKLNDENFKENKNKILKILQKLKDNNNFEINEEKILSILHKFDDIYIGEIRGILQKLNDNNNFKENEKEILNILQKSYEKNKKGIPCILQQPYDEKFEDNENKILKMLEKFDDKIVQENKKGILDILKKLDDENFEEKFDKYIVTSRFKTIRDVKRFCNTFIAVYSQPEKCNIFQYINLTTLQVFYPDLYKDSYINRYKWYHVYYNNINRKELDELDSEIKYFENLVFNYDKYDKQMALELISVVSPVYKELKERLPIAE